MIVIDSDNYAAAGIETMFFPGGEPHVKIPMFDDEVLLFLKIRTWADMGFASLVLDGVSRQNIGVKVFVPYFPGARQDRSDGSCGLTLSVTGSMFGLMVNTFDYHSEAIRDYAGIKENFLPADLRLPPFRDDVVGIIAPDRGAQMRALEFGTRLFPGSLFIQCEKKRDPHSGALSGYTMPPLETVGRYIIVDDICDGGGTFNLLAAAFDADPIGKRSHLELFVSHGIFSKGLQWLNPTIKHIWTTDSWCQLPNHDRLTVVRLDSLFNRLPYSRVGL